MKKIRFGIIGCGGIGRHHARQIIETKAGDFCLTAVADVYAEAAEALGRESGTKWFGDGYRLIDSGLVDAVIIATQHYEHPPLAIYAARRGLHVLTEKPVAVTVGPAREMVRQCAKSGVAMGVMFHQRNRSLMRKMKQMVESGRIGEIFRVQMICSNWYRRQSYFDSAAWRGTWEGEGGGIMLNQAPHSLDLLLWIAGVPKRVVATVGTRLHKIEVENTVNAILEYGGGKTGYVYATTAEAPGMEQLMVCGDKGTLVAQNDKLQFGKLAVPLTRDIKAKNASGEPKCTWTEVPVTQPDGRHIGVIRAFAAHILRGRPMTAEGKDGLNELELSNAIYISGYKGKPVDLPVSAAEMERLLNMLSRKYGRGKNSNLRKKANAQLKKLLGKFPA
ncbi:MAG: Gfo/Idh/MocA family oxidoreductase [Planctomycetota bacterium]|nr:Gfo/Idh/MocA family oxidoreductase [Planctomycetota bacterium]